ncbi:hypothetical protein NW768_010134 [Fusarium equiseti]|uniref:SPX domain-containing protein n=1 Tax=Fusarium equiseti TaxID=61235 RepID=A0ABQ8R188_FUSEQ|nr:hypothetical protein NW768_010134 [Fusarium equiseti]
MRGVLCSGLLPGYQPIQEYYDGHFIDEEEAYLTEILQKTLELQEAVLAFKAKRDECNRILGELEEAFKFRISHRLHVANQKTATKGQEPCRHVRYVSSFCCGLPKTFKRKRKEEQGPIGQARDAGHIEHLRHPVRIDDEGRPSHCQGQPTSCYILHQLDGFLLRTPALWFYKCRPAKDLRALSSTSEMMTSLTSASAGGGPSDAGPSAAVPSDSGGSVVLALISKLEEGKKKDESLHPVSGPFHSDAVVVKGKDKGEAEESGGGNLAAVFKGKDKDEAEESDGGNLAAAANLI